MFDPENPAYNIGEYIEISGTIDPDLFRLAVDTVMDQSDSFHLRFMTTEEGPKQQVERVGRHDNFFELGGHSLLVAKLVLEIMQQFEVELALHDIFMAPVLSLLAARIIDAQLAQFDEDDLVQVIRSMSGSGSIANI